MVNVLIRVLAGGFAQFRELWPYLALGIILAAAIEAFIPRVDLKRWFTRSGPVPIGVASGAGDGSAAPRSLSAAQCLPVCGADMRSRPWGNRWRML